MNTIKIILLILIGIIIIAALYKILKAENVEEKQNIPKYIIAIIISIGLLLLIKFKGV